MDINMDVMAVGNGVAPQMKKLEVLKVETPEFPRMQEGEAAGNYNCAIIDTVNELQNAEYLSMIDPATGQLMTQKKYANLSIKLKVFVDQCKTYRDPSNNGQAILIIGHEGSGKSFGVKYLNPRTTFWVHTDSKPATFKGSSDYKPKNKNYVETRDYDFARNTLQWVFKNRNVNEPFVIYLMGHIEKIEDKNDTSFKEQLKTVGQFAHKLNIEGAVSNCFKTGVSYDAQTESSSYYFDTQNNGHNTIRSQEGLFPQRYIPNNLEYIRQQICSW